MKKLISLIFIIALIIGGKTYIDKKTINYKDITRNHLALYYISNNKKDLEPIINMLEESKNDDKGRQNIQASSQTIITNWFNYINNKYTCTKGTLDSCKSLYDELKMLDNKFRTLYNYKSSDGYTIILPSFYTSTIKDTQIHLKDIEKTINSPSAKNPANSEEIRLSKCEQATCNDCRSNICKCIYINDYQKSEDVVCNNPNPSS